MKRVLLDVAILVFLCILVFLFVPKAALAQTYSSVQLGKVEKIHVSVGNGVIGGCLSSPNELKVEAELILRRSGITVTDTASFPAYMLDIRANGDALTGDILGCMGGITVDLWRFELLGDKTDGLVMVAQDGSIFRGPQAGFPEQLRTFVYTTTTALANEILKARAYR